jgi:hypothetical protein
MQGSDSTISKALPWVAEFYPFARLHAEPKVHKLAHYPNVAALDEKTAHAEG